MDRRNFLRFCPPRPRYSPVAAEGKNVDKLIPLLGPARSVSGEAQCIPRRVTHASPVAAAGPDHGGVRTIGAVATAPPRMPV